MKKQKQSLAKTDKQIIKELENNLKITQSKLEDEIEDNQDYMFELEIEREHNRELNEKLHNAEIMLQSTQLMLNFAKWQVDVYEKIFKTK